MSTLNPTITSANAIFALSVTTVFPSPVTLSAFSVDDAFETEAITPAEAEMGVDGHLSIGFVLVPVKMKIKLAADSPSVAVFDQWYAAQSQTKEAFAATAVIKIPGTGKTYNCSRGALTKYAPLPAVKKKLGSVEYEITWESVVGSSF